MAVSSREWKLKIALTSKTAFTWSGLISIHQSIHWFQSVKDSWASTKRISQFDTNARLCIDVRLSCAVVLQNFKNRVDSIEDSVFCAFTRPTPDFFKTIRFFQTTVARQRSKVVQKKEGSFTLFFNRTARNCSKVRAARVTCQVRYALKWKISVLRCSTLIFHHSNNQNLGLWHCHSSRRHRCESFLFHSANSEIKLTQTCTCSCKNLTFGSTELRAVENSLWMVSFLTGMGKTRSLHYWMLIYKNMILTNEIRVSELRVEKKFHYKILAVFSVTWVVAIKAWKIQAWTPERDLNTHLCDFHREKISKLTFRALALRHSLWRRASARNVIDWSQILAFHFPTHAAPRFPWRDEW